MNGATLRRPLRERRRTRGEKLEARRVRSADRGLALPDRQTRLRRAKVLIGVKNASAERRRAPTTIHGGGRLEQRRVRWSFLINAG